MKLMEFERDLVVFTVSLLKQTKRQDFRFMFSLQRRSKPSGHMLRKPQKTVTLTPVEYAFLAHFITFGRKGESYQIQRQRPNRNPIEDSISVIQVRILDDRSIKITLGVIMVRGKTVREEISFTMIHEDADDLYRRVDSHLEMYYQLLIEAKANAKQNAVPRDYSRSPKESSALKAAESIEPVSEIDIDELIRCSATKWA